MDHDGYRADDINIVRIGHACKEEYSRRNKSQVFEDRFVSPSKGKGSDKLTNDDMHLLRIVEKVSLETIVEDRKRVLQASDAKKQFNPNVSFKYSDIRKQILEKADIVCCTLSGAGSQPILEVILRMTNFKFDAVIIDEAAQAVEPSSLIPLKFNPSLVVMVGDPCQLPATVFSRIAKEANYGQSLFLRLQRTGIPVCLLNIQYRMHPMIVAYPSSRYYAGQLITDTQTLSLQNAFHQPYHHDPSQRFTPFAFHNLEYAYEENEGTSIRNVLEARYVLLLVQELITRYPNMNHHIGIIVPYRAQRRYLQQLFRSQFGKQGMKGCQDLEIATVDGFQGREKDIIIFSCVRASMVRSSSQNNSASNEVTMTGNYSIGFLKEWQRLNVAITRARYALWIVGHQQTLMKDGEWKALLQYAEANDAIRTFPTEKAAKTFNLSVSTSVAASNQETNAAVNSNNNSKKHHRGNNNKHQQYHSNKKWNNNADAARDRDRGRERERSRERSRDRRDSRSDSRDYDRRNSHHQNNNRSNNNNNSNQGNKRPRTDSR